MNDPLPATDTGTPSRRQTLILVVYGIVLWFLAAMLVRFLAPMGALDGWARVLTYSLVVPATLPAVLIARRLARLGVAQTGIGLAVVTAAATLCDGIALAWFPALYAAEEHLVLAGAAVILWGAGVGLALGVAMNGPAAR
jgi:hypothetical protein